LARFQNQDGFPRAGDLSLIPDMRELQEWIVEGIHVELGIANLDLNSDH
jgi:hypothetical protein